LFEQEKASRLDTDEDLKKRVNKLFEQEKVSKSDTGEDGL